MEVTVQVSVFPADVDPTQRDASNNLVNKPIATLPVVGTLLDNITAWEARTRPVFAEWCRVRAQQAAAANVLALSSSTVLTLADPTGN